MTEPAIETTPSDGLTDAQRAVVTMDLGLVGTWWKIMSAPRSFFVRAGVHAGNYGDELLIASGEAPNTFIFFFVIQIVSVLTVALLSGSLLAGASIILMHLFGIMSMIIGFYLLSGVCHLFAKLLRCPGDFEAAKSIVAFSNAPLVIGSFGSLLYGLPVLIGFSYWLVLQYFGFRHVYRISVFKALLLLFIVTGTTVVIWLFFLALRGGS